MRPFDSLQALRKLTSRYGKINDVDKNFPQVTEAQHNVIHIPTIIAAQSGVTVDSPQNIASVQIALTTESNIP